MKRLSMLMALCALQIVAAPAYANSCQASAFNESNPLAAEAGWRSAFSHGSPTAVKVATSQARETEMQEQRQHMENEVLGKGMPGDTPPIEFYAADGVKMKYLHRTDGNSHVPTKIVLSNVGSSGLVSATMLLPVSGHTGAKNAQAWAKTDTYTLKTDVSLDKDGKKWANENYSDKGDPQPNLVYEAKSLDLVTAQDVQVQLVKDKMVRIMYYRSGSGGPAGYFDGRVVELLWDGT